MSLIFFLWTFLSGLVFFQVFTSYGLFHEVVYGYTEFDIDCLFALNTLLIVLIEMPLTKRLSRKDPLRVAGLGMAFVGVGLGVLLVDVGAWWPFFAVVLWTIGEMLSAPFSATYTARRAPEGSEGAWFGWYNAAFSMALIGAPLGGLFVFEHLGPKPLFAGCAVLGILMWPAHRWLAGRPAAKGRFVPETDPAA